jgi:hypothetical protein
MFKTKLIKRIEELEKWKLDHESEECNLINWQSKSLEEILNSNRKIVDLTRMELWYIKQLLKENSITIIECPYGIYYIINNKYLNKDTKLKDILIEYYKLKANMTEQK